MDNQLRMTIIWQEQGELNLINYKGNLMKQNIIIILLTVVATLLLVNLLQNRIPPAAHAAIGASEWQIGWLEEANHCFVINLQGDVYALQAAAKNSSVSLGNVKGFPKLSRPSF